MRKKTSITAANRRRAEDFFSRVGDIFEHKFDGFPAKVIGQRGTGPVEGADQSISIDIDQIIKDLLNEQVIDPVPNQIPCPDADVDSIQSGDTVLDDLVRVEDPEPHYVAPVPIRYFIDVFIDGALGVLGLDYELIENEVYLTEEPDFTVKGRFVVA